ncbi:MAG: helix-turn-helix domain-containing protein [Thermoplasmata archaeon]|nr:helix-turn-helix domain-containing protein [Thermoplasmata archaeon]
MGVKDLAKIFEISPATLSEILRRGQKKIIESFFESR